MPSDEETQAAEYIHALESALMYGMGPAHSVVMLIDRLRLMYAPDLAPMLYDWGGGDGTSGDVR